MKWMISLKRISLTGTLGGFNVYSKPLHLVDEQYKPSYAFHPIFVSHSFQYACIGAWYVDDLMSSK
jgi:hypothetical protein